MIVILPVAIELKLINILIYLLISNLYSVGMEATFSNNQNMCRSLLAFSTSFLIRQYSKKRTPVPLGSTITRKIKIIIAYKLLRDVLLDVDKYHEDLIALD